MDEFRSNISNNIDKNKENQRGNKAEKELNEDAIIYDDYK